jgi:hypothetical protein
MTRIHAHRDCSWWSATALGSSIIVLAVCLIATTARAADPECPSRPLSLDVPEPPSVELRELPNIGELKRQAVNYKCFGQYDKDVTAVLSGAREYVESYVQLVAGKETKLAIVLHIDETALPSSATMILPS